MKQSSSVNHRQSIRSLTNVTCSKEKWRQIWKQKRHPSRH